MVREVPWLAVIANRDIDLPADKMVSEVPGKLVGRIREVHYVCRY